VTTQNTHHEHSDVDASVVEHLSVSETTVAPTASEMNIPTEAETGISASESAALIEGREEMHHEAPAPEVEAQSEALDQNVQKPGDPEITAPTETPSPHPEESASTIAEGDTSLSYTPAIPLAEVEAEVRPFTDFIEEFRLAEARKNATVQESEVEVFSLLVPTEADFTVAEQEQVPDMLLFLSDSGEESEEQETEKSEEIGVGEIFSLPTPVAILPDDLPTSHADGEASTTTQEQAEEKRQEAAADAPSSPVEKTVSPLLRPASRLRSPRHSSGRHQQREEPSAEVQVQAPEGGTEAVPSPTEPAEVSEQPRPARRYRFDRPSVSKTGATSPVAHQRVEESRDKDVQARSGSAQGTGEQAVETKPAASAANGATTEQQAVKQPVAQEPQPTDVPTSAAQEHGRRRQGHDRVKEQPTNAAPASAAEVATPVIEQVAQQKEEIAPEDLPPLEYSELQKASSRRRRRHRSGSSNGTTASVIASAPTTPVAPVVPPPATPRTVQPSTPAASVSNPYTIVSGYTVSQMNQGNEATGPFMGPEPSPARGSVLTREGRTARAEAQRTPTYPSPSRTHESGISAASLTHFANVVSQAIQTQTDRMVAELRRSSQAPTSVSVSLPPFPSTERVGVFVDVANLLYSARTLRIAVDFGKLLDFLRGNRRLVRAHAYCPTSPQPGDEQMFLQAVKGLGYRITTKNYKTFSSGAKKADLDLDLCMDVVRLVDGRAVDCIVLVSGDSDFMPMLDYCSDHGVRVEVAAFDEAMSATLRQSCDLFVNLSMLEEIRS
jgi:uncharacterized LabA/DUF88 family protein